LKSGFQKTWGPGNLVILKNRNSVFKLPVSPGFGFVFVFLGCNQQLQLFSLCITLSVDFPMNFASLLRTSLLHWYFFSQINY